MPADRSSSNGHIYGLTEAEGGLAGGVPGNTNQ